MTNSKMRTGQMRTARTAWAASAAAVALLAGGQALAQVTQVEELVVTAEKRDQNIQDVPAAVSAISGETLVDLGLSRLTDYSQYLPGFNVTNGGSPGQATVTLRGIAAVGPGSVVGFYLDDTPVGSSGNFARATEFALDMLPYELDRFEVLRGPQGTLYGAGAMGGLIKYVLKDAKPDRFSAQVGGDLMSTENGGLGYGVRGAVNVPIGDKFAIRVGAYDQQTAGYTDNVFLGLEGVDDVHQYGGRLAMAWTPTDTLTVTTNALFSRLRSDDNAIVTLGATTTYGDGGGGQFYDGQPIFGELAQSHPFQQPFSKDIDYYSGTVTWDAGPVSIVSASSFSKTNTHQIQDASYSFGKYPLLFGFPEGISSFDLNLDLKKFTQEFRVISPSGGRIDWIVGAFYTREDSDNSQLALVFDANHNPVPHPVFSPFFAIASLNTTFREMAVFGNATWNISDKFDITGGLRLAQNFQDYTQVSDGLILGGFVQKPNTTREDVANWMVNARYHLSDDIMFYGRVATGYRPGGPNAAVLGAKPSVNSDSLTSYETGVKATFAEGRILVNASAFSIDWNDIQLIVFDPTGTVSFLDNAGAATSRGFEVEGYWVPIDNLKLGFNAAYTKAELESFDPLGAPYIKGYQLPGVPEWSGGAAAEYSWAVMNDWRASLGGGVRYVGETNNTPVTAPGYSADTQTPSYTTVDLRAGVSSDRWSVNLWARNISDERVYMQSHPEQNPLTGAYPTITASVLQPRTIGISLDVNF